MIRVRQVKVKLGDEASLDKKVASKLGIRVSDILDMNINRQSLDARKSDIYYVYEVDVKVDNEKRILNKSKSSDILLAPREEYQYPIMGDEKLDDRIVIVGSGPAGLFCSYMLAEQGYRPLVIERGEAVDERMESVSKFWNGGELNPNSNVQFGEGGAGTFSDGKLNTMVKDKRF